MHNIGMAIPAWLSDLRPCESAADQKHPLFATLATVRSDGTPAVRTIVVREVHDDGRLTLYCDARSDKYRELTDRAIAELVLYFTESRVQFRLTGPMHFVTDATQRQQAWQSQSSASREMYFWPDPGGPLATDAADRSVDRAATPIAFPTDSAPATFAVLELHPSRVDQLDLKPTPHRRVRYHQAEGWRPVPIHP